ncbi:MAG: LamG domain-containing protein, partial [Chitinophagaceae bacterium]|nr:LamG domain-containing protein [Chitinophagaceae bacterium]
MKTIVSVFVFSLLFFAVQAQSPVSYYPFNGNANDAIGTKHGTVNGPALTFDRFGNANSAYSFDGINDVVELNHAFNGFTELTLSAWVNINGANQANDLQAIISSDVSGNFVHLQCLPGSVTNSAVYIDNSSSFLLDIPAPVVNTWYFVTLVAKSGSSKMYINGVEYYSSSTTFTNISNTNLLRIGSGYQNGRFLNGKIDEIKIYNTALTTTQIFAEYNNANSGLIAHYPFTGNANNAIGTNHGTVNGATLTTDRTGVANSAYHFDGVDDLITAAIPTSATSNVTMAAWVKLNGT